MYLQEADTEEPKPRQKPTSGPSYKFLVTRVYHNMTKNPQGKFKKYYIISPTIS